MSNRKSETIAQTSIEVDAIDIRLRQIISIISRKWTTLILICLNNNGPLKYSGIKKLIPDIKDKVLVESLNFLKSKKWIEIVSYTDDKKKILSRKNKNYNVYKISDFGKIFLEEVAIPIYNLSIEYDYYFFLNK